MIDTITEYQFRDEMAKHGFSYDGSTALFNYLEQLEEDCDIKIEFDPIGLRCEWSEYDDLDDYNEQNNCDYDFETLCGDTQVIVANEERLIIQDF